MREAMFEFSALGRLIGAATVHWGNGWVFTTPNGGWEYPVFRAAAGRRCLRAALSDQSGPHPLSSR
jgi:hypothetical protein